MGACLGKWSFITVRLFCKIEIVIFKIRKCFENSNDNLLELDQYRKVFLNFSNNIFAWQGIWDCIYSKSFNTWTSFGSTLKSPIRMTVYLYKLRLDYLMIDSSISPEMKCCFYGGYLNNQEAAFLSLFFCKVSSKVPCRPALHREIFSYISRRIPLPLEFLSRQ